MLCDDEIGRAREDMVGTDQVEPLPRASCLAEKPVDRREDLLIGRGPAIYDIRGGATRT
jgi:hypothetical protein